MSAEDSSPIRLRSAPSIPSRFETVLHLGAREKDGFGNRQTRFSYRSRDVPGPGAYGDHPANETSVVRATTSHSQKGYGGFVSKKSRFDRVPFQRAPGPGAYDAPASLDKPILSMTSKRGMAAFVKPVTKKDEKKAERVAQPGPGQYNPPAEFKQGKAASRAPVPAFGVGNSRFLSRRSSDAPAVGTYNLASSSSLMQSKNTAAAAFKSRVARNADMIVDLPKTNAVDTLRPPRQFSSNVGVPPAKSPTKLVRLNPGPGEYDPRLPANAPHEEGKMSQAFRAAARTTDLARLDEDLPGPGTYNTANQEAMPAMISSSSFMSNSIRDAGMVVKQVPGPAYYTPAKPLRKSFHLNIGRKWV